MNFVSLSKELCEKGMLSEKTEEFKNLMLTGPPNSERKAIWLALTGASWLIIENPNYYQKLLQSKVQIETQATLQIDKDLERTFATEKFFINKNNVKKLRNVLVAYSFKNETIGYCQGMNFIAARLLGLGYNEEVLVTQESFWILAQIMEKYMPFDYYTDMSGLLLDIRVLERLIAKYTPKISKHFIEINIDPMLFAVQWFLCVFSYNLPCDSVIRLWDVFFCEGHTFLYRVSLAILYIYRKKILALRDFNGALEYLSTMSNGLEDVDLLLETAERFLVRLEEVEEKRKELGETIEFSGSLNLTCFDEKSCKNLQKLTGDYFTYRSLGSNFVIEEYWDYGDVRKKVECSLGLSGNQDLVVGVKNHYCSKEIPKKRLSKIFQMSFPNNAKIVMPRITLSPFFLQNSGVEVIEVENINE